MWLQGWGFEPAQPPGRDEGLDIEFNHMANDRSEHKGLVVYQTLLPQEDRSKNSLLEDLHIMLQNINQKITKQCLSLYVKHYFLFIVIYLIASWDPLNWHHNPINRSQHSIWKTLDNFMPNVHRKKRILLRISTYDELRPPTHSTQTLTAKCASLASAQGLPGSQPISVTRSILFIIVSV